MPIKLTQAERAKVFASLRLLEEAQNTCYSAAQQICSVNGFADEWTKMAGSGDAAKKLWHRVNEKLMTCGVRFEDAPV